MQPDATPKRQDNPLTLGNPLDVRQSKILGRSILRKYKQRNRVSVMVKVGSVLVTAGATDGEIAVMDVASGELLEIMKGHSETVTALLLHDGKLWSASDDRTLRCWKGEAPFTCLGSIALGEGKIQQIVPGYRCLHVLTPGSLVVSHSTKDLARIGTVFDHGEPIINTAYSFDSLWTMSRLSIVKWSPISCTPHYRFEIKCHSPVSMHVGVERIAITTSSGAVYLTDMKGSNRGIVTHSHPVRSVVMWEPKNILILGAKDGNVTFWDSIRCVQIETIPAHERPVNAMMLCGSTLYSGASDKFVVSWDIADLVGPITEADTTPVIANLDDADSCCVIL